MFTDLANCTRPNQGKRKPQKKKKRTRKGKK